MKIKVLSIHELWPSLHYPTHGNSIEMRVEVSDTNVRDLINEISEHYGDKLILETVKANLDDADWKNLIKDSL